MHDMQVLLTLPSAHDPYLMCGSSVDQKDPIIGEPHPTRAVVVPIRRTASEEELQ